MKLEDLKVGDEVCLLGYRGFGPNRPFFQKRGKVEKVTKTQITAFGGNRFVISSGREVGCAYGRFSYPPRLLPLTDEILVEVELAEKTDHAERLCGQVAELLRRARDEDALRLAAMIGDDLKAEVVK